MLAETFNKNLTGTSCIAHFEDYCEFHYTTTGIFDHTFYLCGGLQIKVRLLCRLYQVGNIIDVFTYYKNLSYEKINFSVFNYIFIRM